jgi:hypothetical protein
MHPSSSSLLLALAALPIAPAAAAEKVLGAFVFARHGDRTAKVLGHTQLTDLGYQQVFQTGDFYHDRYVAPDSPFQIAGISQPVVDQSQISATSPADDLVLQNSATGFLQGLYPPVGTTAGQTLRNGSTMHAPLGGYQLIPVDLVTKGASSENAAWLTSTSGCQKAKVSSNSFYSSSLYHDLHDSTLDFYRSFEPVLGSVFANDEMSFRHAYTIYDYINVAHIHNSSASTPLSGVSTPDFEKLMALASSQQYHLAYNQSEEIRAIAGAVLAGEALKGLNETIASQGQSKLGIRFGSYATFLSYFGLSDLSSYHRFFTGVPDYASSMTWELVTNSTASGFPSLSEIGVRYYFNNGTLSAGDALGSYPLYGRDSTLIPWSDFVEQTKKIAVIGDEKWCDVCGNTDGMCAQFVNNASDPNSSTSSSKGSGGMSLAVAGVIGAMVTLAVILGLEVVFMFMGGFRLSKKTPAGPEVGGSVVTENKV